MRVLTIDNEEWFHKSYKTEANLRKSVEKSFNKATSHLTEEHKNNAILLFSLIIVKLPSGRLKPVISTGGKYIQEGIYMINDGFHII